MTPCHFSIKTYEKMLKTIRCQKMVWKITLARRNHWYWMACWWKPLSHERWWKKTKDFFQQRLYHCQPSSWTLTRASRCTSRCLATLWRSKREIGFWRSISVLASTLLHSQSGKHGLCLTSVHQFTIHSFGLPWKQEHPQRPSQLCFFCIAMFVVFLGFLMFKPAL